MKPFTTETLAQCQKRVYSVKYSIQCTLYNVHFTMYTHGILYTVQYTEYKVTVYGAFYFGNSDCL